MRHFTLGAAGILACMGAACVAPTSSPGASKEERAASTRQADNVSFSIISLTTSPASLLPPELSSLIATASDISTIYSAVTDGIKLLQLIGLIPTDPSVQQLFQQFEAELQQVGATVYDGGVANTRLITFAPALTASNDADHAAAYGQTLPEYGADDTNSQNALNAALDPLLYQRYFTESSTDGDTGWKYTVAARAQHTTTIWDWRLNIPHVMYALGIRLKVMTVIHPNWRVDGYFDQELSGYIQSLEPQLQNMIDAVQCGTQNDIAYDPYTEDYSGNASVTVACADIYTGVSQVETVAGQYGGYVTDLSSCTWCDDENDCFVDSTCAAPIDAYNAALQTQVSQVEDTLYSNILQQMPVFKLRALLDTLNFYLRHSPDLTAQDQRIPVQDAQGLCLETVNGGVVPDTPLWLAPCNGGPAQGWVYNRLAGSLVNPASGLCVDVQGDVAIPGTPVSLYYCQGGPNQQWTYDPLSHVLTNALGTVLDIQWGNLQPQEPVWTWSRNEGLAQQWHADQSVDACSQTCSGSCDSQCSAGCVGAGPGTGSCIGGCMGSCMNGCISACTSY